MSLLNEFRRIRDIPYSIPLTFDEEDRCCTGKAKQLLAFLHANHVEARYRVCTFKWSDMPLPVSVVAVPHEDASTHVYVEAKINNIWIDLDATWDSGLRSVLPVNDWDGHSSTAIAVPVQSLLSHEESTRIMAMESRESFDSDITVNGAFYQALNKWFANVRE